MNSTRLYIAGGIAHLLPPTRCFGLKRILYRWAGANIGKGVRIVSSVKILGSGELFIGDNTWVGHDAMILCSDHTTIGCNCDIAPRVYIGNGTHVIDTKSPNVAGSGKSLPIEIGDGCWICANTVILPGTTIGCKSIIAASSVTKGKIPSFQLWGGGGIIAHKIRDL